MAALWTQHGTTSTSDNLSYMGGYVAFIVLSMIGGVVNITFFAIIGIPKSAKRLHAMLLAAVIQAPFHFFTCTDNGLTLNRFSQDMSLLVMAEGRVVETGPPDELLAQSGSEFAALWASRGL